MTAATKTFSLLLHAAILFSVICFMQGLDARAEIDPGTLHCPSSLFNMGRFVASLLLASLYYAAAQGATKETTAAAKKHRPLDIFVCFILVTAPFTSWLFDTAYIWVIGTLITLTGGWMAYRLLSGMLALNPHVALATAFGLTAFLGWLFLYLPFTLVYPKGLHGGVINPCALELRKWTSK